MRSMVAVPLLAGLVGCQGERMNPLQALEAIRQSVDATRVVLAVHAPIAVTRAVDGLDLAPEQAASALAAGWADLAPCAQVTSAAATVAVDLGDACAVDHLTLGGRVSIDVLDAAGPTYGMGFDWDGMAADALVIDGTADATWATDGASHVSHAVVWDDGSGPVDALGEVRLDVVPAIGDGAEGVTVSGTNAWTRDGEPWSSELSDVRMRHGAAFPEGGTYDVTDPAGRTLTLAFHQVDADSVQISATGTTFPLTWVADLQ